MAWPGGRRGLAGGGAGCTSMPTRSTSCGWPRRVSRKRSGPVSGLKFPGFEHSARLGAGRGHRQLRDRRLGPAARAAPRRARPVRDVRLQHRRLLLAVVRRQALRVAALRLGVAAGGGLAAGDGAAVLPGVPRRRGGAAAAQSRSTVVGAAVFYTRRCCFSRFIEPVHTTAWFGSPSWPTCSPGLYLSVFYLYRRYRATPSRVEKKRLLYLVVGGFATVTVCAARGAAARAELRRTSSSSSTSTSCRRTWSATGCSI